jgi:hypothetical protein
MTHCHIEFWRGADRIVEYESDEYVTPAEARQHIDDLLEGMMTDPWADDWTGCRFVVASWDRTIVLQVPVLATMSALARRRSH